MCENQLYNFEENDFLTVFGDGSNVSHNFLNTPKASLSPTGSPWLDEPDCSTPTRTPVATVGKHLGNMTLSLCLVPQKKRKLTALEKAQKYLDPV